MMKKHMFVIGILIIASVFWLSGCTEQTKKNEIPTIPQTVSQVLFQQDTYLNKEITVIGSYISNFGNCSHLLIDAYAGHMVNESGEEYYLISPESLIKIIFNENVDYSILANRETYYFTGLLNELENICDPEDPLLNELGNYSGLQLEVSNIEQIE